MIRPYSLIISFLIGLYFFLNYPTLSAKTKTAPEPRLPHQASLSKSLIQVGLNHQIQILFEPRLVKGKKATPAVISVSLDHTLNLLLTPHGLGFRRVAHDLIIIEEKQAIKPDRLPITLKKNAQNAPEPPAILANEPPTTVIVRSYRKSLLSARALKRAAPYSTDAVDAEDIGKYPARNAAEALQLVSGVSLERQRGIGLYVSVRGMGPQFQNVQFDGHTVAATEVVENGGVRGRDFRFDILPADLIKRIEVIKSPTADMQEGALGGNISIETLRPFDSVERQKNASGLITVRAHTNDYADKITPSLTLIGSLISKDRKLGVTLSAISDEMSVRNDRFFTFSWNKNSFKPVLAEGLYTPSRTRPTIETEERTHKTVFGALQWRPDGQNETEMSTLWTRLDVAFDEVGLDIYPDDQSILTPRFVSGSEQVTVDTVSRGTIEPVRFMLSRETSLNRSDFSYFHLKHRFKQERFSANLSYDISKARSFHPEGQGTKRTRIAAFGPLTYDFSGRGKVLPTLRTSIDYTDPSEFVGQRFDYTTKDSNDRIEAVGFQAAYAPEALLGGSLRKLSLGGQSHRQKRLYRRFDLRLSSILGLGYDQLGADAYEDELSPTFLPSFGGDSPRRWLVPSDTVFFERYMTDELLHAQPSAADEVASFEVSERNSALFFRADFAFHIEGKPVSANFGVRHVSSEQDSNGAALVGNQAIPVSTRQTYFLSLPSLNVRTTLDESLIWRLSAARTMTRPNLIDLAPRLTPASDSNTAAGGNPNLKPYLATDISSGLDWSPSRTTSLSSALFVRRFDSYITSQDQLITLPSRGELLLSTLTNGGHARVVGLEMSLNQHFDQLKGLWSHTGLQATATLLDVKADYMAGTTPIRDEMIGLSRSHYNLVGYYEDARLMVRLGYYWRARYLTTLGSSREAPSYTEAFGALDGSASFKIDDKTSLSLEGINLLNAPKYVFGMSKDRLEEIHSYGRTVSLALRRTF